MNAPLSAAPEASRHKCLIYDGDPSEQLPVIVPLLRDALNEHWRCLYLGSPESVSLVDAALRDCGVDTDRESKRGSLVLSSERNHLQSGVFEPRAMVDGLCTSIDLAVEEGFDGLCATGDMRWELGDDPNFERLLEYEALLEQVFRDKPLRGICQYHRDILPARAVRDALLVHRSAYVGRELNRDNLFYVPPDLLLESQRDASAAAARQGEWMCHQILRVLKAERERDQVLAALRESEQRQRRLAEQLAAANRDLERRVEERTAELRVANGQLEAFSYSVAHDLRAPLRAVSGFASAIAEDCGGELGENGRGHLDKVLGAARHMGELIDGMLALSRVVNVELRRVAIDLSELARAIVANLRAAEPARSAEVEIHPGLLAVGDPALLRAALTNLLGNAWKYSSRCANARIELGRIGEEAGKAVFFVRDNGVGFDMNYAQRLFGAFQRLHHSHEFPGHGVGLATVERIVSRHGGRVWAQARPNEGATFFFTLPSPA